MCRKRAAGDQRRDTPLRRIPCDANLRSSACFGAGAVLVVAGIAVDHHEIQYPQTADDRHEADENPPAAFAGIVEQVKAKLAA